MSKKQDDFYFQNFIECAGYSCQAAHLLKEILSDFKPEDTRLRLDELHKIEHEADVKKHELSDRLTKAFITPIEREDIAALSEQIDDLTDKIEEVFIRIYINNVMAIRPEALKMLDLVIQCCEEVCGLMREFANFRRSKELKDRIIQINSLEEEADRLYIASMYSLHSEEKDVLAVIAWREIYSYLEKCADACEHAADVVESVVMKNFFLYNCIKQVIQQYNDTKRQQPEKKIRSEEMEWKLTDDRPIWSQLSDLVASQIAAGVYGPGERLPSVRELAAEAGVNPNTMQRAMADLESRGLAVANRTAGRCVTNDMETIKALRTGLVKEQVARFLEKMRDLGYTGDEIRAVLEDALKEGEA